MRRVPIEQLRTGDRLGRNVYAGLEALPLLCTGVRVSDSYRFLLEKAGIHSVWIDDGLSDGIEPLEVLAESTKQRAASAIREAFKEVTDALLSGDSMSSDVVEEMHQVAELIVGDVSQNVHSALALNDLANADGYTLKHSLSVTALGLSIGLRVMRKYGWIDVHGHRRFDRIEERLELLGVGLLLHDIGKLAVPPEVLRKPGPLNDEEWKAMRAHPMLGVQILRRAEGISPLARAVVRSHHERWNGAGYPDGMQGTDIHQFARIAAVADVFDALTSDRCYRRAMPAHEGYDFIATRAGQDFDPEVVEVFKSSVAPYPPGTGVVLSDGTAGLVKEVRPDAFRRPIVRVVMNAAGELIEPRDIDLSVTPGLNIQSTNFEVPADVPVPAVKR
jgi:HD-GYP domain-containing protein (c-di-GMP phosphodiesterase class II)